jgi:hypothetical protein
MRTTTSDVIKNSTDTLATLVALRDAVKKPISDLYPWVPAFARMTEWKDQAFAGSEALS